VEPALFNNPYLLGDTQSIADIAFACDFMQFLREGEYEEQLGSIGFNLVLPRYDG
jgi:glutathione S-transferase